MLHEAGYDYENIPNLTVPEIRRLLEGRRVDGEIQNMIRKTQQNGRGRRGAALGRAVPRKGDNELLEDYANRMKKGEAGKASLSLG